MTAKNPNILQKNTIIITMSRDTDQIIATFLVIFFIGCFMWALSVVGFSVESLVKFFAEPSGKSTDYKNFSRCCKRRFCNCEHNNNLPYADDYYKK